MSKECKICGNKVYAKGLCQYHYWKARADINSKKPESPYKSISPKSYSKIPPRTKKRREQELAYSKIVEKMNKDKVKYCFFCGKKMAKPEDKHHVAGRWGQDLLYEKLIVHAHRECHAAFHDKSAHDLPWFLDYVNRLSDIDPDLAEKEMQKLTK